MFVLNEKAGELKRGTTGRTALALVLRRGDLLVEDSEIPHGLQWN